MEDTYVHIRRHAGDFDPAMCGAMVWMVALARRRAIDLAREPENIARDADPELDDNDGPAPVPRRELTEELKRLLTCIGRLEPERQRMLLLAYYGAFSRRELAMKLGMEPDQLCSALHHSLVEIDKCLTS
jgi:RNA polymerase sigma-70 factor, ECF subfamily